MEKDVKEFSTATDKLIQVDIEKEMRESFLQYSLFFIFFVYDSSLRR